MSHSTTEPYSSRAEREISKDCTFTAAAALTGGIRSQIERVARTDLPVLLFGECNVGKEFVARLIHELSTRADHVFLKTECGAAPSNALENELFGYDAAAGIGSSSATPGKLKLCDNGTIFLDSVEILPSRVQGKMLQVLDDKYCYPVDGQSIVSVDVRIVAGTTGDIEQALTAKTFREDLYYRLNVIPIHVLPLRECAEDIPLLFHHFLKKHNEKVQMAAPEPSEELLAAARQYLWPGNLQEFEDFVKCYVVAKSSSKRRQNPFDVLELIGTEETIPGV